MAEIRPATLADREAVCAFLHHHFESSIPITRYGNLFTYPWLPDKPDYGYVLAGDSGVKGYISTIYADRMIEGAVERFCNLSSWYVLPEFRNQSLKLLGACHRGRDVTYTNLTARPAVQKISEAMRYARLGRYKLFTPPLGQLLPDLMEKRPRVGWFLDAARIGPLLEDKHRRILDDHVQTPCRHLLVEEGSRYCYVVWNRRVKKGIPFSEVLYMSDAEMFRRYWEPIKLRILWHDRTPAMAMDEHILPGPAPWVTIRYERITLFRSARVEARSIDNLYSELALL